MARSAGPFSGRLPVFMFPEVMEPLRTYPLYRNGRPTATTVTPSTTPVWPGQPILPDDPQHHIESVGTSTRVDLDPDLTQGSGGGPGGRSRSGHPGDGR